MQRIGSRVAFSVWRKGSAQI